MRSGWSRWRWWVVGGTVVIVGVVGGPYVYIHFIEGKAPAPLSVLASASPTASSGAGSSGTDVSTSIDGTWKVGSGSTAGYRVKEILFAQSNIAVGRTSSVTGSLTVSGDQVTAGTFRADLKSVVSDQARRDNQFRGRVMDTSSYPTATFVLTQPIALGQEPADGATVTRRVTGNLTLHGTTRLITFDVSLKKTGSLITASGSVSVIFADYNIPNPSFGNVVTTDPNGALEFLLNFTKA